MMSLFYPRLVIAALRGGSGKTILSLGLIAAWREQGRRIAPFKKGPDFIDAGWLGFAADRACHNLDAFLMTSDQILTSFRTHANDADFSLIEGNRGLFDGLDKEGSCSTAELAKFLKAPAVIVVDVTMATRTVAAIVRGCQVFDAALEISGVILNRVAGSRQESLIRSSIEEYCDTRVLGALPKMRESPFPERYMGLVPHQESEHAQKALLWAKETVKQYLDIQRIWEMGLSAGVKDEISGIQERQAPRKPAPDSPKIGVIRDKAFWFYYPENLKQLETLGASLIQINAMSQKTLPELDALYIGGGFPEIHAEALADNRGLRRELKDKIQQGLPVYAECGGLMYLGKSILTSGRTYPMVGALPIQFVIQKKPQGHGYTVLEVDQPNPYYPLGTSLRGHEFHYSKALLSQEENTRSVFKVRRGHGVAGGRDGLCFKNLLATYTHVHGAGNHLWAEGLLRTAMAFRDKKQ